MRSYDVCLICYRGGFGKKTNEQYGRKPKKIKKAKKT